MNSCTVGMLGQCSRVIHLWKRMRGKASARRVAAPQCGVEQQSNALVSVSQAVSIPPMLRQPQTLTGREGQSRSGGKQGTCMPEELVNPGRAS